MNKIARYILPPGALIMLLSTVYLFRVDFLEMKLDHIGNQLSEKNNLELTYEGLKWDFPTKVSFENISLQSADHTLFSSQNLTCTIDGTALMTGDVHANHLGWESAKVDLSTSQALSDPENPSRKANLIDKIQGHYALINGLSDKLPASLDLKNNQVVVKSDTSQWRLESERILVEKGELYSLFRISDNEKEAWYGMSGGLCITTMSSEIEIVSMSDEDAPLPPYKEAKTGFRFDNMEINTWKASTTKDKEETGLIFYCEGLEIEHPFLSKTKLIFPELSGDLSWASSELESGLTPGCRVFAGDLEILPEVRYNPETEELNMSMIIPQQDVERFMEAIPEGAKDVLSEVDLEGSIAFHVDVDLDPVHPESVDVHASLKDQNLTIKSLGSSNLDQFSKPVPVAGAVKLSEISPMLRACVIIAEDPHFTSHNGFDRAGAKLALKENLTEGKIVRGGSTITMQLVKNQVLSSERTPARKVEEAALTWLIENKDLASKDEILEHYLNLIEWGPGINGIGEAASFYFEKTPDKLNLEECIFLSNIIPNPKYYQTLLDSNGRPGSYAEESFNSMKLQLWTQGLITEDDLDRPYDLAFSSNVMRTLNKGATGAQAPH